MTYVGHTDAPYSDGHGRRKESERPQNATLFVICELGKFGKRVCRVFLKREAAEAFMQDKTPHLYKFEEFPAPPSYSAPSNLFAAHEYDEAYMIHRLTGFHLSHEDAKRQVGIDGLVLSLVPED